MPECTEPRNWPLRQTATSGRLQPSRARCSAPPWALTAPAARLATNQAEAEALGADASTEALSTVFNSMNDKLGKGLSEELHKLLYETAENDLSKQQASADAPLR